MSTVSTSVFGILPSGLRVDSVTLTNAAGLRVEVVSFGATVVSVKVPRRDGGASEEVTLCRGDLESLRTRSPYAGSTVGRVANRIARGAFSVGGRTHALAINNGANALHGGVVGWDKVCWTPRLYTEATGDVGVEFTYSSHDGEEGYPGNVRAVADYRLSPSSELSMTFSATTDKATPINMCNHAYWNLSGDFRTNIKGHSLQLHCSHYLPVDSTQIPTGEVAPVAGTPFDFVQPALVGSRLAQVDGGGEWRVRAEGGREEAASHLTRTRLRRERHATSQV